MISKKSVYKYVAPPVLATALLLSPALSGNASAETIFSTGATGTNISDLQTNLKNHGLKLSADGIYGPETNKRVRQFQKEKGLAVDGIAGPDTLGALKSKSSGSKSTPKSTIYITGNSGSGVSDLQSGLKKHGYSLAVDGIFGPDTKNAVNQFQKAQKLQIDGIAGSKTLSALNGKPADKGTEKSDSNKVNDVVSVSQGLVGKPYVFGGTTPSGFDSSGFINYVFNQVGVNLNRTHADMWVNNGTKTNNPEPGDVVFFENTYKNGVSHSGVYIGNGEMIHAGTEKTGVEVTSMDIGYWNDKYIGAKSMQ